MASSNRERINRAVVDTPPFGRTPPFERKTPPDIGRHTGKKEKNLGRNLAILTTVTVFTAGGSLLIASQMDNNNPNETPGGGVTEPSKSPNPSKSIIIPSATPKETLIVTFPPSPTPSATPEATSAPNIENVKLVSEGSAAMEISGPPKGIFNIYGATVVALEKNPDGTVKDFAVTVGSGKKVTRIGSPIFKDLFSFKNVTFWINVKDLTLLADINYEPAFKKLGEGSADISKYIVVGKSMPEITMYFDSPPGYAALNAPNNKAYDKLNANVGKTFPRSYRGFTFNAGGIAVQP